MKIEKKVTLTLADKEIFAIQKVHNMLLDICSIFRNGDCNDCPLCKVCGEEFIPDYTMIQILNAFKN